MQMALREPLEYEVLAASQGFTEDPVVTADGSVVTAGSSSAGLHPLHR